MKVPRSKSHLPLMSPDSEQRPHNSQSDTMPDIGREQAFLLDIRARSGEGLEARARRILWIARMHAAAHRRVCKHFRAELVRRYGTAIPIDSSSFLNDLDAELLSHDTFMTHSLVSMAAGCETTLLPNINLILTTSSGGLGDVLGVSRLAQALTTLIPPHRLHLIFCKEADYHLCVEKLPDIATLLNVTVWKKRLRQSSISQDINVFYTAPWTYGRGEDPSSLGLLGFVNIILFDYNWPVARPSLTITSAGSLLATLCTGIRWDSTGIHLTGAWTSPATQGPSDIQRRRADFLQHLLEGGIKSASALSLLSDWHWCIGYLSLLSHSADLLALAWQAFEDIATSGNRWSLLTFFNPIDFDSHRERLKSKGVNCLDATELTQDYLRDESCKLVLVNVGNIPHKLFVEALHLSDSPVLVTGNLSLAEAIDQCLPFIYVPIISENVMTSLALRLRAVQAADRLAGALEVDDSLAVACNPWDGFPRPTTVRVFKEALTSIAFREANIQFCEQLRAVGSLHEGLMRVIKCLWVLREKLLTDGPKSIAGLQLKMVGDLSSQFMRSQMTAQARWITEGIIQEWNSLPEDVYREMYRAEYSVSQLFTGHLGTED